MSRGRAAYAGVTLVLSRVPQQLSRGTTGAHQSAADIFATDAVRFRDLIPLPDRAAGFAEGVDLPEGDQEDPGEAQVPYDGGSCRGGVLGGGNV
jgi:hypothetical protein